MTIAALLRRTLEEGDPAPLRVGYAVTLSGLDDLLRAECRGDPSLYSCLIWKGAAGYHFENRHYLDGGYAFILAGRGIARSTVRVYDLPIAVCGFVPNNHRQGLDIDQLQSLPMEPVSLDFQRCLSVARSLLLRDMRWERFLLRAAISWAGTHGLAEVRVRRASRNAYYHGNACISGFSERLRLRYDVTPRRLGFHQAGGREWYHTLGLAPRNI